MKQQFRWLAGVIAAHPNRTVKGRTRLQKTVLLLQKKGLPTQYSFSMHFYGPYSEEIMSDVDLLTFMDFVEEAELPTSAGRTLYVLKAEPDAVLPEMSDYQPFIDRIERTDLEPLELAATFAAYYDASKDDAIAMQRLRIKKARKCTEPNLKAAMKLLRDLGLHSISV